MNPSIQKRLPFSIGIVLILAMLACSAPAASTQDEAQPTEAAVEQVEESTSEAVEPVPTEVPVDPASVCPEPTADTLLYVDEVNGFCLLYPASFSLGDDAEMPSVYADVRFIGAVVSEGELETVSAVLRVNVIGQPGVAVDYPAAEYADSVNGPEDTGGIFAREEVTVSGGLPGMVVRNQPGMLPRRSLYVNAHDTLYEIEVSPDADPDGAPVPDVELAWTTMLDSLTLFPPTHSETVQLPEEICSASTADATQYINRVDGYCMLVPNSFEEDPEYGAGWFIGGPELTGLPMGSRLSAVVGMSGTTGETVGQIADRHIDAVPDKDSVIRTDTTVAGYPAVFWERPQGTIPSRNALIVADGYQYSLVVQPVDPVNYPEAVEPAELVWNTFIDSFVFFEPWQ